MLSGKEQPQEVAVEEHEAPMRAGLMGLRLGGGDGGSSGEEDWGMERGKQRRSGRRRQPPPPRSGRQQRQLRQQGLAGDVGGATFEAAPRGEGEDQEVED
ncbi:hypothetical protein PLESTF_000645100 [Pleodorina starrii]|nr:hypothetical protein PLESTF_000645100 [Pleodorina starrii]